MTDAELPLLKASALYFDKLYILDPEAASWGTVGADAAVGEARSRLDAEGVFERLRPEEAIESHGDRLLEAVREDCRDPEFLKLCQDSGKKSSWTLALAKVPLQLRQEEVMRELLGGLPRALVGDLMHGGAPHYAGGPAPPPRGPALPRSPRGGPPPPPPPPRGPPPPPRPASRPLALGPPPSRTSRRSSRCAGRYETAG
ncbi:MAG: hypothetical protein IPM79_10010 [Polyangiaceae bacterium]|nr:hypothetical protein [Polyangiaceae bacterium]